MDILEKTKGFVAKYSIWVFGIAVLFLLIIIIIWCYTRKNNSKIYNDLMEGLWIANDDFCNRSEIDGMLVFIGPSDDGWFSSENRRIYIIMNASNKIALNEKFEMNLSGFGLGGSNINKTFKLTDLSGKKSSIFPAEMIMKLDLGLGKMSWEFDDTTYAELYKDNISRIQSLDKKEIKQGDDSEKI